MNIKTALFSLVLITFLAVGSSAQAATPTDSRYFVKSTSQFWKKSFQVRNIFDGGFTADLSLIQLKLSKVFGVEVTPVKKLNILATTKKPIKPIIKTPTSPIGWGVKAIYGDSLDGVPVGGEGINVAVLDTGALISHPDLKGQVIACSDFSGFQPFVKNYCDDKNGHGTQVSGVIAANGGPEGNGMYGVAPDANLIIYKVCAADGTCFADDVAVAIRVAVDTGANIVVISLGSDAESSLINDAISYAASKNVMVIAAAGNDGPYTNSIDYPASNDAVVSVGALDDDLNVAEWSARADNLQFVAPGANVESTSNNSDYVTSSGTSMAAAHIAGIAAKEWQADAKDPVEATRDLLRKFSTLIISTDNASGWGMPQL